MRITVVLGPFQPLPPDGYGAVEKVWYGLSRVFAQRGHEVTLIGKGEQSRASRSDTETLRVIALEGFSATGSIWLDLAKDLLYSLQVRNAVADSGIVVTNSFWLPVVLSLGRPRPRKIIVHVARFPKGQTRLYGRADLLQAVSSAVAEEIGRQAPFLRNKVRVLPNPIDLAVFRPPETARPVTGKLRILYVGRVHPEKGVDLLLKALGSLSAHQGTVSLRIIGPTDVKQGGGGMRYLKTLEAIANGLPVEISPAIRDPAALNREYHNADCFCYPSLAEKGESFGLSILEAMATGLPVVVSDLACFRDLIRPDRDGLIFDHRARVPELALGSAIERLLTDRLFASKLGQNAARRAEGFGLERIADRYIDLFREIAVDI